MRSIRLLFFILSLPALVEGAWTRVGTFAVGNDVVTDNQMVIATSATLEAGNVGVCSMAHDETGTGTTDGAGNAMLTQMIDAAGNPWQCFEWCNMQTVTVRDGACTNICITQARFQLTSGSNITFDFAGTPGAKAATCDEFTVAAGASYTIAPGGGGLANDGADPGSMTDATGLSAPYLFIRTTACESNATTYTADTDYVGFGGSTTTSTAVIAAATSMGARGESRIATEGTSAASDPTHAAADCASQMIAFREVPCVVGMMMGIGCR
jgi:hypothetical protein